MIEIVHNIEHTLNFITEKEGLLRG